METISDKLTNSIQPNRNKLFLKNIVALIFGLFISLLLFFCADQTLGILKSYKSPIITFDKRFYIDGMIKDDDLGYHLLPNLAIPVTKIADNTQIYSVVYNTDEVGRRIVPDSTPIAESNTFLAFFGCSFTFGEGVRDTETLPNQVAQRLPGYRVYNYGVPGYGPQQMFVMIESDYIHETIPEKKGIVVYTIFYDHVNRAAGRMNCALMHAGHFPYFQIENGALKRAGNFDTDRVCLHHMMSLLNKSGFIRYFNIDFPPLQKKDYELTAKLILESKKKLEKQFEAIDFYVLVYPAKPELNHSLAPVFHFFKDQNIRVLDFHTLAYSPDIHALHPRYDMHPTPLLHAQMADLLSDAINNDTEKTSAL
ncbi:MAG: hypothetical protein GX117_01020 [Candidatus Hydrogenedentes bacterium]|nr:hypothetical protein [Candidatus Hydrogenedentota bacterium]